jgi:hypothetical protein
VGSGAQGYVSGWKPSRMTVITVCNRCVVPSPREVSEVWVEFHPGLQTLTRRAVLPSLPTIGGIRSSESGFLNLETVEFHEQHQRRPSGLCIWKICGLSRKLVRSLGCGDSSENNGQSRLAAYPRGMNALFSHTLGLGILFLFQLSLAILMGWRLSAQLHATRRQRLIWCPVYVLALTVSLQALALTACGGNYVR